MFIFDYQLVSLDVLIDYLGNTNIDNIDRMGLRHWYNYKHIECQNEFQNYRSWDEALPKNPRWQPMTNNWEESRKRILEKVLSSFR